MCDKAVERSEVTVEKGEVIILAFERNGIGHPLDHHTLNKEVREAIALGARRIVLKGVLGQRYIGATASARDLLIEVHGTPGNNLGAFLNGSTIEIFGNAQDLTGNTMNSGRIVIHGSVRDVTGLAARGGEILIKESAGYRTGIHMKEFRGEGSSLIIGGRSGDYLGEYMAGGTILVLGLSIEDLPPIGQQIGAGMHGGRMFINGKVSPKQLAPGASMRDIDEGDRREIDEMIGRYERTFGVEVPRIWERFTKIAPSSSRPFVGYYDPSPV